MESLRIVVGAPTGRELSHDLWGVFLEDINYSLDGGLNADLVRNGDFEASPADHAGWGPLTGWSVESGDVRIGAGGAVSSANATYATLTPGTVLVNRGYNADGMPLPTPTLRLALWARARDPQATLTAALRAVGKPGEPLDVPIAAEWRRVEVDLRAPEARRAELTLQAREGAIDVDLIELRPLDASGRPELFRPDLVEALQKLHPAFVRFPGGCIVHGFGLDNMYHWKNTVGPREQRRPMPNSWGYHQSMSIGYHEYFLLCERLGATPVPIVAAGVCCQNVPGGPQAIPAERMPQYVQDVLDLVEYANGDPDTRWGGVRAAAGHPEPFGMRMIGLGNEDTINEQFTVRFTQIVEAVRATHPEIEIIGTAGPWPYGVDFEAGWKLSRELDIDIVDEHGYRRPRWLWQNHRRYDEYERSGPVVYVGEWAAHRSSVRAAMAEAAYMVGMERNADIVRMASYAPLLARVGDTQWRTALIYFTDDEILGSAAYDVHRVFAETPGEQSCEVDVDGVTFGTQPEPRLGPLRFTAPGTRTVFTEIEADGVRLPDVVVDDEHPEAHLPVPPLTRRLAFTATRESGVEGFVARMGDPASGTTHEVIVGSWRNRSLILSRTDEGIGDEIDGPYIFDGVRTGVPRRIEVERDGWHLTVHHDGELVHDHMDDARAWPEIVAGAVARVDGAERVVTVVNGAAEPREVHIRVDGWTGAVHAEATVLEGNDPERGDAFEPSPLNRIETSLDGSGEVVLPLAAWSMARVRLTS